MSHAGRRPSDCHELPRRKQSVDASRTLVSVGTCTVGGDDRARWIELRGSQRADRRDVRELRKRYIFKLVLLNWKQSINEITINNKEAIPMFAVRVDFIVLPWSQSVQLETNDLLELLLALARGATERKSGGW